MRVERLKAGVGEELRDRHGNKGKEGLIKKRVMKKCRRLYYFTTTFLWERNNKRQSLRREIVFDWIMLCLKTNSTNIPVPNVV